ncbi:MAG: tRNA (adenosine(37)-N6)-dimethylallyltransferase MiaA [Candidatus Binatia bacterium]
MPLTKPKLVIVLGPTAVGKSKLALELAPRVDGEIINADSQQVYRHMDIGTGKPSETERQSVCHHLIDVVNPDEDFNAALYRRLATEAIGRIHHIGKNAVVCGGTGLYLQALTHGLFTGPGQDPEIRRSLEAEINNKGLTGVYQRLVEIDGSVTSTIHPNDRQRIIRALEVYESTGKPLSEWQNEHAFQEEPFEVLKIGLLRERAELYEQINRRAERMIEEGLLEEVRGLVMRGFGLDLKPLRSVGYRQMGAVIRGTMEPAEAAVEMKQETRHLAKRQLTWFRRDAGIRWYHPAKQKDEIFKVVSEFLQ